LHCYKSVFYFILINKANDVSTVEESYQTPNRIHIHLGEDFVISDYVFPDENEHDIKDRISELFNYELVDPSKQIYYAEELPRNFVFSFFLFVITS
jgi:hypothetical protein